MYWKPLKSPIEELKMISVLTKNRDTSAAVNFLLNSYNKFTTFGCSGKIDFKTYIKLREHGDLDICNGYLLKEKKIFQSESAMKHALDVLWQTKRYSP
jgi:hypothetical protein